MPETPLTDDHQELYDTLTARRYFAKFERITGHMLRVAGEVEAEGRLTRTEARILGRYLAGDHRDVPGLELQVSDDRAQRRRAAPDL